MKTRENWIARVTRCYAAGGYMVEITLVEGEWIVTSEALSEESARAWHSPHPQTIALRQVNTDWILRHADETSGIKRQRLDEWRGRPSARKHHAA
jgi:hypothetical protein